MKTSKTSFSKLNICYNFQVIVDPCPNDAKIVVNNRWLLTSPNYPQDYEENLNCKWTFSVPIDSKLAIKFHSFEVWCSVRRNLPKYLVHFLKLTFIDSMGPINRKLQRWINCWRWINRAKSLWTIWRFRCTKYDCVQ